ncbi:cadherin domain-containing protein [Microvirga rosea]|uniref:cadherin domain-containing protein n=1 Tax=Microvirga rosea TaxID=2715425 RepID=UPI001D0AD262|nr:cadherin domain-containing protein [Microvirga rosea]MCB8819731.1 cadherin domain-containing protein [Microvirga rosea]
MAVTITIDNHLIDENVTDATNPVLIGTLTADDGETYTYVLADPAMQDLFTIDGDKIYLAAGKSLNYEEIQRYDLTLDLTDSNGDDAGDASIRIDVNDLNDNAPTEVTLSGLTIAANAEAGDAVGSLGAVDADTPAVNTFSYKIVDAQGNEVDDDLFEIVAGQVVARTNAPLAEGATHEIRIQVSDGANTFIQNIIITGSEPNNTDPYDVTLKNAANEGVTSISEAATGVIGVLGATDDEGNDISFTIKDDDGTFEIVQNTTTGAYELKVKDPSGIDYDTAANHTVSVTVIGDDGHGGTVEKTLTLALTDVNDNAPTEVTLSGLTIAANAKAGDAVGTLSAVDDDTAAVNTFTYTIVDANGDPVADDLFEIVSGKLVAKTDAPLAKDAPHEIRIQVSDGVNAPWVETFVITGAEANNTDPHDVLLKNGAGEAVISISETATGVIGVLSATDDEDNDVSFTIKDDDGTFEIVQNDQTGAYELKVKDASKIDYETAANHAVSVTVIGDDGHGGTVEKTLTLALTDVNDNAPTEVTLSNLTIAANAKVGDEVGTLGAVDADTVEVNTFTYKLVDADGNEVVDIMFGIVDNKIIVESNAPLDEGETRTIYVQVSDGVNAPYIQQFVITGSEANNTDPHDVTLKNAAGEGVTTISEAATGVIGILSATDDEDNTVSFTIKDDDGTFEIVQNTTTGAYELKVKDPSGIDYDTAANHTVSVTVIGDDGHGGTVEKTLTLALNDVNDNAPTEVTLSNTHIIENAKAGDEVGTLGAVDDDTAAVNTFTYTLVDGNGDPVVDDKFEIVSGKVVVKAGAVFDREAEPTYMLHIKVSDGVNPAHIEDLTITIDPPNTAPHDVTLKDAQNVAVTAIAETAASGSTVGLLGASDAETDDVSFTIKAGSGDAFGIRQNNEGTYELYVKDASKLNYETAANHKVSVTVLANDGYSVTEETLTLDINDVNEAPTGVNLGTATVKELAATGTVVGALSTQDQDGGDAFTYKLLDDAGGRFAISGSNVVVKDGLKLDYEQAKSHQIKVEAKDKAGHTFEKILSVGVLDVATEKVTGSATNDVVKGGKANDVIKGNAGNDVLWGGLGKDTLYGGTGKDVFVFNTKLDKKTNLDKIADFNVKDDTLWLDNAIFKKLGKGSEASPGKLNKGFFTIGTQAKDKNDFLIYDDKKGVLFYDADGSGAGKAIEIATLSKKLKMTADDFKII